MAHGYLTPTDIRVNRNYLGAVAGAIGSRIGKASDMARRERAYASKKAKDQDTTLKDEGMGGRGYFFKRALGSTFGGDRVARTRGRFESDPPAGRDPTSTQQGRFRGGFNYDFSKSATGGALANIVSPGGGGVGGGAAGFPGSGSSVINPDVLGGAMVQSQYRATTQNSNVSIDTTATEVKDLAGILNQIGQIIVSSSNSTIQAVDSVQQVNVQVIEGIKSLGQLQARIADRQIREQKQIADRAEQNQMIMMSRLLSAQEKTNFTEDDFSHQLTPEKGYGFGGKGGGFIGGLISRLSDFFGMRMPMGGGFGGGGAGGAARGGGMLGGASRALGTNRGSMVNRMGGNFLARNATRMFGRGGLMPILRPIFKRIPIFGGLIDFAVSLALGEPVGRAAAKAVGATLGAGLGSLIPVPGVGTIAGGILGDFAGGAIYDAITGSGDNKKETVPQLGNGAQIKGSKNGVLVRVGEKGPGKNELVKPLDKKVFEQEEQTRIDVQHRNRKKLGIIQSEGLKHYYEKENGWDKFMNSLKKFLGGIGKMLKGTPLGFLSRLLGANDSDEPFNIPPGINNPTSMPEHTNFTGEIKGNTFNPLPGGLAGRQSGQKFGDQRSYGGHTGVDITEHKRRDSRAPVIAYKTGKIVEVSNSGGNPGGVVRIRHADGMTTSYRHITPRSGLQVGQDVGGGQHIGNLFKYFKGGTEMTHLHFEVHDKDGKLLNPTRFVDEAKNNIANPLSDAKAAEIAGIQTPQITPEEPRTPTPAAEPTTGRPTDELSERLMGDRSALLNTMRTFDAQSQNAKPFANREGKHKGEKLSIPGVGSIVKDRPLFGDWFNKYYNASGNPISEKEFFSLIEKQRKENQQKLKGINEDLKLDPANKTMDPWASANADTGNGILKASADVSANASKPPIVYLNNSAPQKQQGGSSDSSAILAAMGSASSSPSSWTPAGWHNAILDA